MANYLPVLLVSVSTNAVPDDSALSTLPRAQVDYLSHDWQEEDVWRSWRNMTRQKNEIANGVRLENASWRTWWKQRNNLPTVTPETLNWLKDSDVTWLYGPLHTAVDWAPPRKSDRPMAPASAQDRLDLANPPTHKPILKYRSISELLTSDLHQSPIFSPNDSDDAYESSPSPALHPSISQPSKRPTLTHTKSDTHITRWGPSRAFRKDSPPRIDPPGHGDGSRDYFYPADSGHFTAPGAVHISVSQDSTSSGSASGERQPKKKHISFNTFVEQCIAIEKPKKNALGGLDATSGVWHSWDEEDGYEEDQEDNSADEDEIPWEGDQHNLQGSAIDSDSTYDDENDDDDADEDGGIQMRPSSFRNAVKASNTRSKSKVSTTSSSSNTTTSSTSTSASGYSGSQRYRRSSTSTYRPRPPPLQRAVSDNHTHPIHVTIAPIAPTILKTGAWVEGFGDEGSVSDDGTWDRWSVAVSGVGAGGKDEIVDKRYNRGRDSRGRKDGDGSDGTPVELVYVPPFGSNYSFAQDDEGYEEEDERVDDKELSGPYLYGSNENADMHDGHAFHSENFVQGQDSYSLGSIHQHSPEARPEIDQVEDEYVENSAPGTVSVFTNCVASSLPLPTPVDIPVQSNSIPKSPSSSSVTATSTLKDSAPTSTPSVLLDRTGTTERPIESEDICESFRSLNDGHNGNIDGDSNTGISIGRTENAHLLSSAESPRPLSRSPSPRSSISSTSPSVLLNPPSAVRIPSPRRRSVSVSPSPVSPGFLSPPPRGRSAQDLTSGARGRTPPDRGRTPPDSHVQRGRVPSDAGTQRGRSTQDGSRGRTTPDCGLQRGRSSTRSASMSASTSGSGLGSGGSPFGSLSPDGTGAAYASGRVGRDREGRTNSSSNGKERGRAGRGRDPSSRPLENGSSSIASSLSCSPEVKDRRIPEEELADRQESCIDMETSSSCTESTLSTNDSTSSTATVIPDRPRVNGSIPVPVPGSPMMNEESRQRALEEEYMRRAEVEIFRRFEEERLRRVHPTPSNSPILSMHTPGAARGTEIVTNEPPYTPKTVPSISNGPPNSLVINTSVVNPAANSTPSSASQYASSPIVRSPSSHTSPPTSPSHKHVRAPSLGGIIPSPPHPAMPSTSYAVSQPLRSPTSQVPHSPLLHPQESYDSKSHHVDPQGPTIVGKAVGMVSSAGAYLGFWHSSS